MSTSTYLGNTRNGKMFETHTNRSWHFLPVYTHARVKVRCTRIILPAEQSMLVFLFYRAQGNLPYYSNTKDIRLNITVNYSMCAYLFLYNTTRLFDSWQQCNHCFLYYKTRLFDSWQQWNHCFLYYKPGFLNLGNSVTMAKSTQGLWKRLFVLHGGWSRSLYELSLNHKINQVFNFMTYQYVYRIAWLS